MSEHKKHTDLKKPDLGIFHRNEWAIHGAPCDLIQEKTGEWISKLKGVVPVSFLDASHQEDNDPRAEHPDHQFRTVPGGLEYFRNESLHDLDLKMDMLSKPGVLLINGNHFKGRNQIVILDERKRESLHRKKDRLSAIDLVLTTPDHSEPYDFLAPFLHQNTTILSLDDTPGIKEWFEKAFKDSMPRLNGLVLAGGKSVRRGVDKGSIQYHENDQREHTALLLRPFCNTVFISCRPDQISEIKSKYPLLPDSFGDLGPLGAILSAFRHDPDSAWLVVACDMPLLNSNTLDHLIQNRKTGSLATAFATGEHNFPEPLITIWEPPSYPRALQFLAMGHSCPRKVLINSDTSLLSPPEKEALTNINTVEEKNKVLDQIRKKSIST